MDLDNIVISKLTLDDIYEYIYHNLIKIEKCQLEKFEADCQLILYKLFMDDLYPIDIKNLSDNTLKELDKKDSTKINFVQLLNKSINDFQFLNLYDDFKKNILNSDISYNDLFSGDSKKIRQFISSLISFRKFKDNVFEKINLNSNFNIFYLSSKQIINQIKSKKPNNAIQFNIKKNNLYKNIVIKTQKIMSLREDEKKIISEIEKKNDTEFELVKELELESIESVRNKLIK